MANPEYDNYKSQDIVDDVVNRAALDLAWGWTPVSTPPRHREPIEMTGSSGYIAPNERFVISGYYDPVYRPHHPWLDSTSTQTSEMGWIPTHWRYLTPGPR